MATPEPEPKTPRNGNYVTWRELVLWGKPFNDKLDSLGKSMDDLKFMVEQIHVANYADKAIERYKEKRGLLFWTRMATIAALVGALAYIVSIHIS